MRPKTSCSAQMLQEGARTFTHSAVPVKELTGNGKGCSPAVPPLDGSVGSHWHWSSALLSTRSLDGSFGSAKRRLGAERERGPPREGRCKRARAGFQEGAEHTDHRGVSHRPWLVLLRPQFPDCSAARTADLGPLCPSLPPSGLLQSSLTSRFSPYRRRGWRFSKEMSPVFGGLQVTCSKGGSGSSSDRQTDLSASRGIWEAASSRRIPSKQSLRQQHIPGGSLPRGLAGLHLYNLK